VELSRWKRVKVKPTAPAEVCGPDDDGELNPA
jgi:hypothetical protein